jgi:putative flippase GtrA
VDRANDTPVVASRPVPVNDASTAARPAGTVLRLPDPRRARPEDWAQLVRFCLVGASGYFLNLAVFSALVEGGGVHYIPSAVLAFCVAWSSNFVLNKHWTFRRHGLSTLQQGVRNLLVSLAGLGLNLALLHLLVVAGVGEVLSQALAIAAVTPVSFLLNRRWSFR